ncbi:MAG: GNAT family protein [Myxococcota bacterium]
MSPDPNRFEPFPRLTSARLELRDLEPDDAEVMFRLGADPQVLRYLGRDGYASIDDARRRMAELDGWRRAGQSIRWVMVARADLADAVPPPAGLAMGTVSLWHFDDAGRSAEVGYDLLPEHWGRGYASEAVLAAVTFAFERLGLHRVQAQIDPANVASARVLEKVGFAREGHLRENWHHAGVFTDSVIFGLLDREHAARRAASERAR